MLRPQPDTGTIVKPQPTALRVSGGHLQPLLTPDPLHARVVHSPAVSAEQGRDTAVTILPVMPCQRDDAGGQEDLIICQPGRVSMVSLTCPSTRQARRSETARVLRTYPDRLPAPHRA